MIVAGLLTLFLTILIPTYWKIYGVQNFLWFSNIGLFLTCIAFWLRSSFLLSAIALIIIPVELVWNVDFFIQLISSQTVFGLSDYMFDRRYSFFLRGLSFFHCLLPILIMIYIMRWGYKNCAVFYSMFLVVSIILLTYFFTDPEQNINWVFTPQQYQWTWMPSAVWLVILILFYLVMIKLMQITLKILFGKN